MAPKQLGQFHLVSAICFPGRRFDFHRIVLLSASDYDVDCTPSLEQTLLFDTTSAELNARIHYPSYLRKLVPLLQYLVQQTISQLCA